jgi:hypothetical protein
MPVTSTVMQVHVEHRMFVAFDPRHPVGPPLDDVPADADFLVAGAGGLVLCSAGNDFYPDVRVDVWDQEPPPQPAHAWEETAEATMTAPSGRLRIASVMRAPAGADVTLGPAGDYSVRVHARGRGEAMERLGVELYYHGIEAWLLELWPS